MDGWSVKPMKPIPKAVTYALAEMAIGIYARRLGLYRGTLCWVLR